MPRSVDIVARAHVTEIRLGSLYLLFNAARVFDSRASNIVNRTANPRIGTNSVTERSEPTASTLTTDAFATWQAGEPEDDPGRRLSEHRRDRHFADDGWLARCPEVPVGRSPRMADRLKVKVMPICITYVGRPKSLEHGRPIPVPASRVNFR
jgi:hypothetical protein